MRRTVVVLITAFAAAFTVWSASAGAGAPEKGCGAADTKVTTDLPYLKKTVSDLQQVDVYGFAKSADCDAPVVVYVHGGGWRRGDKQMVGDKATFFNGLGYVFVSVNYRLSDPADSNRVVHPTHAEDVGAAVTWVERNIDDYGGNGKRIALMGHSAGGHLVSLVGVDPSFIDDSGGDPSAVKCVVSNDTEGYDIESRAAQGGAVKQIYDNAFGTDVAVQRDASPMTHVADQDPPPDFLVITRGTATRVAAATAFADAVEAAGGASEVLEAKGLTHGDVNRLLGSSGDTAVTPTVETFVTDCLG